MTIIYNKLCCFVKAPLEAIVESVGLVINKHGMTSRSSMKPSTLDDEIHVSWNGPNEFSSMAGAIIKNAVHAYFNPKPIHFYKNNRRSTISTTSSTVAKVIRKPSIINF